VLQNYAAPGIESTARKQTTAGGGELSIVEDSVANNDNRAEPPKNQAQRTQREYKDLMRLLKERVEEMNANSGNLPQFVVKGSTIQLGHIILHLDFDPRYANSTDFVLVLRVGYAPFKKPLFGSEPPAVRHMLQPIASYDLGSVVWVHKTGNLGQLESTELAEFALDLLTGYYRKHKPN
jgi:hypothetical protein